MSRIPSSNFELHKFGCNIDVDGAEDIWDGGGNYLFPAVAFQTEVVGGASDLPNSDGVHSIQIEGLDINGVDVTEVATLNGATPVVLTNSYFRVNRAFVKQLGAVVDQLNSFDIGISHTGSATLAQISAQEGQTLQTIYTLPANVSAYFLGWHANGGRSGAKIDATMSMRLQTRQNGEGWRTRSASELTDHAPIERHYDVPKANPIKPFSDIRIRATAVNTNNLVIAAGFELKGTRRV